MSSAKDELDFWKNKFCKKVEMKPIGVLIVTVQRNRTGEYISRVIDFDRDVFHPVYPEEVTKANKNTQRRFGELLVCYCGGLPTAPLESRKAIQAVHETNDYPPFCCSNVAVYKPLATSTFDAVFTNMLCIKGHRPDLILEVIRQVSKGPKIKTTYWTLKNDVLEELPFSGEQPHFQKKDVFKNYVCSRHDLFFGLNLLSRDATHNFHHMRLYNFSRDNDQLLREFRQAVYSQEPQCGLG